MSNLKEPKIYLVLRILGFTLLAAGIGLIVSGIIVSQNIDPFESSLDFVLIMLGMFAIVFSIALIIGGFSPKMSALSARTNRYVQEISKGDLKAMADTQADISMEAVSKTAKAIKDGIDDKVADTMFCKHCGETIDQDSKFCKHCGKEL
jgi:hypothetical protein